MDLHVEVTKHQCVTGLDASVDEAAGISASEQRESFWGQRSGCEQDFLRSSKGNSKELKSTLG